MDTPIRALESRLEHYEASKNLMEQRLDYMQLDLKSTRTAVNELLEIMRQKANYNRAARSKSTLPEPQAGMVLLLYLLVSNSTRSH